MDKLLVGCLLAYVVAFALFVVGRGRAGLTLFVVGTLGAYAFLGMEWHRTGHPPLANMFHVMVLLSGCFLPVWGVLAWRSRLGWLAPYFALVAAVPMVYAVFKGRPEVWRPPAGLLSAWWIPHVGTYIVSYSLAAVAFVLIAAAFLQAVRGRNDEQVRLEEASYEVMAFAFPLMTFGLVSGALWADQAWGRCWAWDPKETWSLITWTLYVMYFHCRRSPGVRSLASWVQVLAFLALLATFILVSVVSRFSSALHSYA